MQDLQYWREYVRAGFRIIQMHKMERNVMGNMACTCNRGSDCRAVGKHPRSKNWQKDRHDSIKSLDMMGGRKGFPYFGVSLENLLVVDVDPRNGGWEGLEALEAALDMSLHDESLFIVETGGGGLHFYFRNPEGVRLRAGMAEFKGIDFKRGGGHFVMGAGSLHKSGGSYDVKIGSPSTIGDAPASLIELIKAPEWENYSGPQEEADLALVESALFAIPNDDVSYDDWLVIGLALAHWDNDNNFDLFDRWSQQSTKYDENETDRKWRSFGTTGARTIGTIFGIASDHGWQRPQGPAWGVINLDTGELFQDPKVKEIASGLAARFASVSMGDLEDALHRRDQIRRQAVIDRTAMRQPEPIPAPEPDVLEQMAIEAQHVELTPEPELEEPVPNAIDTSRARSWGPVTASSRAAATPRPAASKEFVIPDDDVEFGDAPDALQQVASIPEYRAAAPAKMDAPASVPPPRKGAKKGYVKLPGLAGRIVDHIERTAWSFQRPAAEAAALQALSCAAWGAYGYASAPMSLITLVVADTASGKDHPQKVFTRLMDQLGRPIVPEVRSDKDFMYMLAEQEGKACLVIDEAHAFFGAMENTRAPAYMVNLAALLLKAATSDRLHLARTHLNDITDKIMSKIRDYNKQIDRVSERKGVWEVKTQAECDSEINKCETMIARLELQADDLKTGIKGVHFNLMAASTPVKFNQFINAETVGSGLGGRSLVFDCGYGAPPQRRDMPPDETAEFHEIAAHLRSISDQALAGIEVRAQDAAEDEFNAVYEKYIADEEVYNHGEMGGLNRRIRERVYAISSILAAGNSWMITPEIVKAALRLCEAHLAATKSLLKQNDWEGSVKDSRAAVTEVVVKILKRTTEEKFMNRGTFRQRLEKNAVARAVNKQMTDPKSKGKDFLAMRVEELRNMGVVAVNGSNEDYTRIWLTEKGHSLGG